MNEKCASVYFSGATHVRSRNRVFHGEIPQKFFDLIFFLYEDNDAEIAEFTVKVELSDADEQKLLQIDQKLPENLEQEEILEKMLITRKENFLFLKLLKEEFVIIRDLFQIY